MLSPPRPTLAYGYADVGKPPINDWSEVSIRRLHAVSSLIRFLIISLPRIKMAPETKKSRLKKNSQNIVQRVNSRTRLQYANSIASWDNLHNALIKWCSATSSRYLLDSNNLLSIADKTGKSAITAVVMTALVSPEDLPAFRLPPVDGFRPKIHTKC